MASRFSISAIFEGIDKISQPVNRMANRVKKFTQKADRQIKKLGRSFEKLGGVAKAATKAVAVTGITAVTFALVTAGQQAVAFEQTMVNAAAKFGPEIQKGTEQFKLLEEAAKKTGRETEFTAVQSAGALNFLAMAGFNAVQSIAALPGVVDLATVAQIDLATATDIATDTLGAMGLATKDPIQLAKNLTRVNDVLAKTTTTSNTSLEQLFETVASGAADFTTAGQSMETFAALAGTMANAGKKGEAGGTVLRNVMVRLAAPTDAAGKLLKRLGVRTQDQAGNFRDVVDILADFEKGLKGMGTAQKTATISTIFGLRAQGGINILLKAGAKNIKAYRKQLEAATGASKQMAATMRDTMQGRINSLISAFEGLQLVVFGLNDGAMSQFVEKITEATRTVTAAISANQELGKGIVSDIIDTILGVVGVVGILIGAFLVLKTVTLTIQAVMLGYQAVMLGLKAVMIAWKIVVAGLTAAQWLLNIALNANPLGLLVVGVLALIAVGALLFTYWEQIADFFVGIWDTIGGAFSTGIDFIMGILKPFQMVIGGISGLFAKFGIVFDKAQDSELKPENADENNAPQMVSPAERVSRSIEERTSESKSTLTIKDETGRAELKSEKPSGVKLKLATSGAF